MRTCDIVVLSRFPEIFKGLQESIDADWPSLGKCVVWDGDSFTPQDVPLTGWATYLGATPFEIARNANQGFKACLSFRDILYCGDDTRIIEPDTIKRLQEIAYSDPMIGILSPKILGSCAMEPVTDLSQPINELQFVGFVFIYIKREVIEKIGYLDERYEGYSWEDLDYAVRARQAGFKIAMTNLISVKHGVNGHSYGSTFIEVRGEEQMGKDTQANMRRFAEKFGIENSGEKVFSFIRKLC